MESQDNNRQEAVDHSNSYATHLLINEKLSASETIDILIGTGLDEKSASMVVENVEQQIKDAEIKKAQKDMISGGLWCLGGLAASGADLGYIFWGAIVFGAIQFFRGAVKLGI